ncbi:hypothetical protein [Erythrobacter sp. SG61-1L]|uniref:hypothetical protein n=1 Tax=Erythrobacter sp. SG61-1L TaxID=1603897 RepID=UPI0006C8EFA1|nr:hypothetical protein [Erythrobacter sp. SG61-1L]
MPRSFIRHASAAIALAAAFSMVAAPVSAANLPGNSRAPQGVERQLPAAGGAESMAGWDRRHRHDRGGIDAGDVLAGVLIIGGIAAIASAASNSSRNSEPNEDYRYREPSYPYPDERPDYQGQDSYRGSGYSGGGIDNAVSICTDQVERGATRVASVDNAARTADGWRISGQLDNGGGFNCWIDNDGRVRNVDLGGVSYSGDAYPGSDNQWDDDAYARAREQSGYPGDYRGYEAPGG